MASDGCKLADQNAANLPLKLNFSERVILRSLLEALLLMVHILSMPVPTAAASFITTRRKHTRQNRCRQIAAFHLPSTRLRRSQRGNKRAVYKYALCVLGDVLRLGVAHRLEGLD